MPVEEPRSLSKVAEMSFSDWKKMKSSLKTSEENKEQLHQNTPQDSVNKPRMNLDQNSVTYTAPHPERSNFGVFGTYSDRFANQMSMAQNTNALLRNRIYQFHASNNGGLLNQHRGVDFNQRYEHTIFPHNMQPTARRFNQQGHYGFSMGNNLIPKFSYNHPLSLQNDTKLVEGKKKTSFFENAGHRSCKEPSSNVSSHTKEIINNLSMANSEKKHRPTRQKRPLGQRKPEMPPPMIATTPESKLEKQNMWKQYRKQMKPFKNHDFLNAKRVIQRLKKFNYDELDEKQKDRFNRAQEYVTAHRKMLSEKAAQRERPFDTMPKIKNTTFNSPKHLTNNALTGAIDSTGKDGQLLLNQADNP